LIARFRNHVEFVSETLTLPITKHFAGYVPYTWKYTGPDILYTLIDKPIIDKHHNVIASQVYLDLINQIEHATPTELIELCKTLNVKYIILREDVNTNHPYIKLNHPPEYYKDFLENSKEIVAKKTFGNFSLYEIKNYTPRIFLQPVPTQLASSNLQDLFKKPLKNQKSFNSFPSTKPDKDSNKCCKHTKLQPKYNIQTFLQKQNKHRLENNKSRTHSNRANQNCNLTKRLAIHIPLSKEWNNSTSSISI